MHIFAKAIMVLMEKLMNVLIDEFSVEELPYHVMKVSVRAHLHQRGAGPPAGAGSVFRAGRVFTLARVRTQFNFTGAPFRGTGSLIYKYRPISAPYSCGSRRRIAPWAISAGARRGPALPPRRARGGVNSTTQFLQTDSLRNPQAGSARAPRAFSALV